MRVMGLLWSFFPEYGRSGPEGMGSVDAKTAPLGGRFGTVEISATAAS